VIDKPYLKLNISRILGNIEFEPNDRKILKNNIIDLVMRKNNEEKIYELVRLDKIKFDDLKKCIGIPALNKNKEVLGTIVKIIAKRGGKALYAYLQVGDNMKKVKASKIYIRRFIILESASTPNFHDGEYATLKKNCISNPTEIIKKIENILDHLNKIDKLELIADRRFVKGEITMKEYLTVKDFYRLKRKNLLREANELTKKGSHIIQKLDYEKRKYYELLMKRLKHAIMVYSEIFA